MSQSLNYILHRIQDYYYKQERLAAGEVERTDSGVGSETSKPSVVVRRGHRSAGGATATREGDIPLCDDCDAPVDTHITNRFENGGCI